MSDAELIALAALANVEAVQMAGANAFAALCNEVPTYREGCGLMPATLALQQELRRRGIKV